MPHFNETHSRGQYKVQGLHVEMPSVFAEGHVLTANEAKWMNGSVASTIGNAYGGDVRRAVELLDKERADAVTAGTYTGPYALNKEGAPTKRPAKATVADLTWDHQAKLLEKFAGYELGSQTRGVGKSLVDEIAHNIATAWVKNYLKTKGQSIKKFMDAKNADHGSEFGRLVNDYLTKKHDDIYAQAQAQIDGGAGSDEMDLGDLANAA